MGFSPRWWNQLKPHSRERSYRCLGRAQRGPTLRVMECHLFLFEPEEHANALPESGGQRAAFQTLRAFQGITDLRARVWSGCVFSTAFGPRFMGSPLSRLRMKWDPEPGQGARVVLNSQQHRIIEAAAD